MVFRRPGFTIIELMITIVIVAILIMVAAPSLRDLILNARMTGLANNVMTDLAIARSEAVKRRASTAICPTNTAAQCSAPPYAGCACANVAWNQGWIIFQDSNGDGVVDATTIATDMIKYVPAIDGSNDPQPSTISVTGAQPGPCVRFLASGVSAQGGAGTVTFSLCDSRSLAYGVAAPVAGGKGRKITVSGTGRAVTARCTCNAATPPVCP
jgi:type IV fimbrial biogenesis protein FimT